MEDADGTRSFVNIEIPDIAELGRMDYGTVLQGLQRLVREGRAIKGKVLECGASGSTMVLQSVK